MICTSLFFPQHKARLSLSLLQVMCHLSLSVEKKTKKKCNRKLGTPLLPTSHYCNRPITISPHHCQMRPANNVGDLPVKRLVPTPALGIIYVTRVEHPTEQANHFFELSPPVCPKLGKYGGNGGSQKTETLLRRPQLIDGEQISTAHNTSFETMLHPSMEQAGGGSVYVLSQNIPRPSSSSDEQLRWLPVKGPEDGTRR